MSERGTSGRRRPATIGLSLAALGVVFGDIGTSPLYAMREVFNGPHALAADLAHVYGVVALVFWAFIVVVTLKYVVVILRVDNHGEGGIMALVALLRRWRAAGSSLGILTILGIFGAALFYGDGMITPAISVLSAVEGLQVAAPGLEALVVPLALVILTALFAVQRFGTGTVGALFGPVMLVWFAVLAGLGAVAIATHPAVLAALSPHHAVRFIAASPGDAFLALGSVVLVVTGAEALYADMGHFGRPAIVRAWLLIALPALMINYLGQAALVIDNPAAVDNPFFRLAPEWGRWPLVVLACAATVVAAQAVISGVFSVTRQAIQLGFLPRMEIRHTSSREEGQIYLPAVNWLLFVAVAALVIGFGSSSNLASAYGVAVTATLIIDTILATYVIQRLWGIRPLWVVVGAALFLLVDGLFFAANIAKVLHGGWFPLVVGVAMFTLLVTWWHGRRLTLTRLAAREMPLQHFLNLLRAQSARGATPLPVTRVPGTAVYLTANHTGTPLPLKRNVEHNHVLHERVVLFTSRVRNRPTVADGDRLEVTELGQGLVRVVASYGFQERPDAPAALRLAASRGTAIDPDHAWYVLNHFALNPVDGRDMALWRKRLFVAMSRNSFRAAGYLRIPSDRAVEVGTQIDL